MDMRPNPERLIAAGYGWLPILAGADKFTHYLADWEQYLAPWAKRVLPVRPRTFMKLVGVLEILVGLSILARPTRRAGARLASGWLGCIAVEVLSSGRHLDIAARDALLALGAWRLSRQAPAMSVVQVTELVSIRPEPPRAYVFADLDCEELTSLVPVQ